jgi:hypothetical protein
MMITITKAEIKAMHPCIDRWEHFLTMPSLIEDEPIRIVDIISHNGVHDALWVLGHLNLSEQQIKAIQYFALACARRVEYLGTYTKEIKDCNNATELFLKGVIGRDMLRAILRANRKGDYNAADASAYAAANAAAYASDYAAHAATANTETTIYATHAALCAVDAAVGVSSLTNAAYVEREWQSYELIRQLLKESDGE